MMHFTHTSAGKAGKTVRDLSESVADLARTSAESVSDAAFATQRQLGQHARATRRHVGEQPWKSALIASAVAGAAAALVVAVFRSRRDRK